MWNLEVLANTFLAAIDTPANAGSVPSTKLPDENRLRNGVALSATLGHYLQTAEPKTWSMNFMVNLCKICTSRYNLMLAQTGNRPLSPLCPPLVPVLVSTIPIFPIQPEAPVLVELFKLSTVLVEPNLEASRRVDHWGAKTFPDTYSPKFQNAKNLKRHFWRREKCKPLWLYCVFVLFCGLFGASVVCLLDFVWLLVLFCLGSRVGRQRAKITLLLD